MPNPDADPVGSPEVGKQAAKLPGEPDKSDGQNTHFKSHEDAEVGYKELQAQFTKVSQDLSSRNKVDDAAREVRLKMLEDSALQAQQTSVNAAEARQSNLAGEQRAAQLAALREEISESPENMVDHFNTSMFNQNKSVEQRFEAMQAKHAKELAAVTAHIDGRLLEQSPEYGLYSDIIEKMVGREGFEGVSRAQMLSMAKELEPDRVVNVAGSAPYGSTGGTQAGEAAVAKIDEDQMAQEMAFLRSSGTFSDDQLVAIEARIRAEAEVV